MLLYVPQETQCTKVMLPLTVESAFPEEAGLPTAEGALATPEDFDGDLAAFLGGIREKNTPTENAYPHFNRASKYLSSCGKLEPAAAGAKYMSKVAQRSRRRRSNSSRMLRMSSIARIEYDRDAEPAFELRQHRTIYKLKISTKKQNVSIFQIVTYIFIS